MDSSASTQPFYDDNGNQIGVTDGQGNFWFPTGPGGGSMTPLGTGSGIFGLSWLEIALILAAAVFVVKEL